MRIDSHQHFWKYHPDRDTWITDDMRVIQRNFLPGDLYPLLLQNNMDGCVAVQADQSEDETRFLLELAEENDFIKGVVGWVDFRAPDIEERLAHFSQYKKLKGFRHIVQAEPENDFLLREDFCQGIKYLQQYRFTYDILIFPQHLPYALDFVNKFPSQQFVIDHLAKPDYKKKNYTTWEKDIRKIAACENVYCKLSGLVTEADWQNWVPSDFSYCLSVVTEAFGTNRLLFGSDWPVSLLAATYSRTCSIIHNFYAALPASGQDKIWGENAINFYHL